MNPQTAPTPVARPSAGAVASAQPTSVPVPTPSLKPGEVITWIKLERPRLALGEILIGSFALVGLVILMALSIGILLGHLRSKRTRTQGTSGLGLR